MNTGLTHDVAVIGGGPAGLSAAVTLARSLRSVVLVDGGDPRNAPATAAHNVLARDGISPLELLAAGLIDELPDVPGVREFWGKSALHCAYCHGWEVRGQRIGVLGTSTLSVHQALLFRQLSDDVTLFRHTMPDPGDEAWDQLAALDIRVVSGVVHRLRSENDVLRAVVLDDGHEFPVDALTVAPRFIARADLYEQLGGTLTDHPTGAFITTGPMGRTEIPGVWAAGNVSDLVAMVAAATGAGVAAAAAINADLVAEDAGAAIRARAETIPCHRDA